ncbi:MAG TPA: TMEM175 family protein [Gemmatimonadaceae bacterium]|nr:TMEM175 family protein [Gemmatimonadaceae bacterium]
MGTNRLEAFSDGVIAIIITIMVLELKVPHGVTLDTLAPLAPVFMSYVLSFIYIGIYWNNHHHMLHTCARVTGGMLWANLPLLFWLSLFPFVTGWMGENHFAAVPTALYGGVLLAAAIAYWVLQRVIIAAQGPASPLKAAIGSDWKGKLSPALYLLAIVSTFFWSSVAQVLYVAVALMWLVPDRRIERSLHGRGAHVPGGNPHGRETAHDADASR